MKALFIFPIILISLIVASCNNAPKAEETKVASSKTTQEEVPDSTILKKGQQYVKQTQSVLGKNLIKAIETKGVSHALEFCSAHAYPLTDSVATVLNVQIKRVSDKTRNPENKANQRELDYITGSKARLKNGESIKPRLMELEGRYIGYYPIMTNAMCMHCHGEPNIEILAETLQNIQELYPEDEAVGYKPNELRGIWVVETDK